MSEALSEVLAGLTPSDVEIDASGRIVIKDPEVAQRVKELSAGAEILLPNQSCNHGCGG